MNKNLIVIVLFCIFAGIFSFLCYSEGIILGSNSIQQGMLMPAEHTCDGANYSPDLHWSYNHPDLKSYAIIFEDIDAPVGLWVHWILFDIPPETKSINTNTGRDDYSDGEIKQGINDWGRPGYGGPCPPQNREHRYVFRIFALDRMLELEKPGKADIESAIQGHILASGEFMTRYKR